MTATQDAPEVQAYLEVVDHERQDITVRLKLALESAGYAATQFNNNPDIDHARYEARVVDGDGNDV